MARAIGLLILLTGAVMIAMGVRQSSRARAARTWTSTTARVIDSRVDQVERADEQRRDRFGFVIRYAYEARGRRYESDQVWIGSNRASASDDVAWARGWVERFPSGAEVPAWFDPADPAQAVLVREVPRTQLRALLAVGVVAAALGLFLLARG